MSYVGKTFFTHLDEKNPPQNDENFSSFNSQSYLFSSFFFVVCPVDCHQRGVSVFPTKGFSILKEYSSDSGTTGYR